MSTGSEADGVAPTGMHEPISLLPVDPLLRYVLDQAADALISVGEDGTIVFANRPAVPLFGYAIEELLGQPLEMLVPEGLREAHRLHRAEYASEPMPRPMGMLEPFMARRRDGSLFPVEISLSSIDTDTGRIYSASVRDVTNRVEMERRSARTRRLYSMLAAANAAVLRASTRQEIFQRLCDVATADRDFVLAWVGELDDDDLIVPTARAGRESVYAEDLVVPRTSLGPAGLAITQGHPVVSGDIGVDPQFEPWRDRALEHGLRSSCAMPLRAGDHVVGVFNIYSTEADAFDQERVGLLSELTADVSVALAALADREAEEEARRAAEHSEARMEAVLAHGRDLVALLDGNGRATWMSSAVERMLGGRPGSYIGRDLSATVHPDDAQAVWDAWVKVADHPGATALFEMRLLHHDGDWRWMEVHIANQTTVLGPEGYIVNLHDVTDERRAREDLRFQADLLASVGDVVVATDRAGRIVYWNAAAERLYGWAAEEVLGASVHDAPSGEADGEALLSALREARAWSGELLGLTKHGGRVPIMASITPLYDEAGEVSGVVGVAQDITERFEARRRLEARAEMQAEVARLGQLALAHNSLDTLLDEVVLSIDRVLGLDVCLFVELLPDLTTNVRAAAGRSGRRKGQQLHDYELEYLGQVMPNLREPLVIDDVTADGRLRPELRNPGWFTSAIAVMVRRKGEAYGVLGAYCVERRPFDPDEANFMQSLANIVASAVHREDGERELVSMALHDALTGLPNRTLLSDRIEHALERAARADRSLGVLLVDLDRFKLVNDALGHHAGDQLLIDVAARLEGAVRAGDTVARLGGDEFAVLCEDLLDVAEASAVAARIGDAMQGPFEVEGAEMFVTASVGITVRKGAETTGQAMLREADAAMYRAKEAGRSRHEIFDDEMRRRAIRRLELTNALRRALEREELRLHWQPELPLAAASVAADGEVWAEALVRWEHPELGLIGPNEFIDLAEDTGLIGPLGEWVLRAACRQLVAWHSGGRPFPSVVSVNLSARQLAQPDLVDVVAAVLAETGVAPSCVMLEITETAVMHDPATSIERLGALRELGLGLAIDDFGTGYSSLTYLRRLPVTALKIDRSFVSGVTDTLRDRAIVEGIIGLAHATGLATVAEGVESPSQHAQLVELGCDWAQGYLWSKPLPADELQEWIAARGR